MRRFAQPRPEKTRWPKAFLALLRESYPNYARTLRCGIWRSRPPISTPYLSPTAPQYWLLLAPRSSGPTSVNSKAFTIWLSALQVVGPQAAQPVMNLTDRSNGSEPLRGAVAKCPFWVILRKIQAEHI
jgi:hypothetical protein